MIITIKYSIPNSFRTPYRSVGGMFGIIRWLPEEEEKETDVREVILFFK